MPATVLSDQAANLFLAISKIDTDPSDPTISHGVGYEDEHAIYELREHGLIQITHESRLMDGILFQLHFTR